MEVQSSLDSVKVDKSNVQTYNLMVTIIEASDLVWHGMLTQIKIKFGKKSRKTGVKAGTDSPYYNEFFVFSFKGKFDNLVYQILTIDVYRPCHFIKRRKLIGNARFDLSTIWMQPDHAIVEKWIVLTHPNEPTGSIKGYLKCNIAILPPGTTVKKPLVPRFGNKETRKDLFVPESLGSGKLKALYIIKIYKIIGMCKGLKRLKKFHKCYVKVNYAGFSGTTTSKNLIENECLWNEEIVFTEVFPPLYSRLKIDVYFRKKKICSRCINLREIADPAVKGFLPTYGPAHIHLYKPKYNYIGSLLLAIETKTAVNLPAGQNMVAVKTSKISDLKEGLLWKTEEFSVFGLIMDVSMLDKKIKNKNRLSISMSLSEDEKCPNGYYSSCSNLALRKENSTYFIDINDKTKPTLFITKNLPDLRHRVFISNALKHVCKTLRNGLEEAFSINEHVPHKSELILKSVIDKLKQDCSSVFKIELHAYTELQKERIKIIQSSTANALKAISKSKFNALPFTEKFKTCVSIYKALRRLINDPQDDFPYLVFKLKYGNKLLAFKNISVKDILFSTDEFEKGVYCGRINCIFLTDAKKNGGTYGKLNIYLWFGLHKSIGFALNGIPPGHTDLSELTKIPATIHYKIISTFIVRAHIYHGRFEPCQGIDGDCKISVKIHIGTKSRSSSIVTKTMCPVWKESITFTNIIFSGEAYFYKNNPVPVVIEVWNYSVKSKNLLGRMFCKPQVYLLNESYELSYTPLKWFKVEYENIVTGEILALFEMIQVSDDQKNSTFVETHIPKYVVPNTVKYKLEVLCWGIRDRKLFKIEHPKVIINCGEAVIESQVMKSASSLPNFSMPLIFSILEIPENMLFSPPLVIRLFDTKSFGTFVYMGSHVIKNVNELIVELVTTRDWGKIGEKVEKGPKKVTFSFTPKYQNVEEDIENELYDSELSPLISHLSLQRPEKLPGIQEFGRKLRYNVSGIVCCKGYEKLPPKLKLPKNILNHDLNEKYFDWWTKYFDSSDHAAGKKGQIRDVEALKRRLSDVLFTDISKIEFYTCELEKVVHFEGFNDVLRTFDIKKSKSKNFRLEAKNEIAKFKGAICLYKDEGDEYVTKFGLDPKYGYFGNVAPYSGDIVDLTVRVYVIRAHHLHKRRKFGSLDTYIQIVTPSFFISDKDKYVSQDYEPVFGKCFEFDARLPFDSVIKVDVMNWNRLKSHQLVGETKIDIENRYYSKHRGTCGLQEFYHKTGYNYWRDIYKPTEILEWFCQTYNLPRPKYGNDFVEVAKNLFKTNNQFTGDRKECLALSVLRNWHKIPIIGCHLVKEHVETRSLYHPDEPGIEQGKLEMWIDLFPKHDFCSVPPQVDISPRIPDEFELRIILWSTSRTYTILANDYYKDDYHDLFVKSWIEGKEDLQQTDVHFRSWSGDGLFNWRFIFQFAYYREGFITRLDPRKKKERLSKIPPVVYLQLWDNNRVFPNLYLGALALDLHRIPVPTKKLFGTQIQNPIKKNHTLDLFQRRNVRGWWEFKSPTLDEKNKSEVVIARAELEMSLLNLDEAKRNPVGYGRNEPFALPTPLRPHARCSLLLAPFRALKSYIFKKHKWTFIKITVGVALISFILLFIYAIPSQFARKLIFS